MVQDAFAFTPALTLTHMYHMYRHIDKKHDACDLLDRLLAGKCRSQTISPCCARVVDLWLLTLHTSDR